jgi:2Fe-2S ferredoxin
MEAGVAGGVPFEMACGGNCECCTCHVYLNLEIMQAQDYTDPEDKEIDALDFAEGATEESRLAC